MVRRVVIFLLGALFWAGCGSSSFVGRRFDNFTAYYNTFYNARKSYESGFEAISQRDEPVDRNQYISLFVRPSGQTGNRDFDSAVLKSADVLRRHGNSKWVDDALLLIGKAYFYQENIVGALEKFREVIESQSALEDEARFWFARTLIISRSYDEALTFLQESIVRDEVSPKWRANFQLALSELYVQRQDWDEAADALTEGLQGSKEKEIAARAQFLLGQVLETQGNYTEAARAYRDVRRYNPLYELAFAADLSAIRVEGLHGDAVRALKDLRKMERDDKHFEYLDDLRLLRGRIIQRSGDADQAFNIYADLLYDENRAGPLKSELLGKVHFAVAELYRDLDGNYVLASAHFDTAAQYVVQPTAGAGVGRTERSQFAPEAITNAAEIKDNFGLFAKVYGDVAEMDSLLWLGSLEQEAFDAKILEYRQERARILERERKEREARLLEQQFRQAAGSQSGFSDRGLPPTKTNPLSQGELQRAGYLFHRDKVRADEGRANFVSKWGDRPRVRNWRRMDAVRSQPAEDLTAENEASEGFDLDNPATLPEIDVSGVPRDSLARAQMISKRAVARYELGNAFFLALEMPDSSAVWYRRVIEETGDEPVATRSYYALAEVQRALGDSVSAEQLYDEILERFPDSEYASKIKEQRGVLVDESVPDSAAIAKEIYGLVYDEWQSGEKQGIIEQLILLAARFRGEEASAQALLAGAQFHLEQAGSDTSAVLAPLDILLPDSVLGELWPDKLGDGAVVAAKVVPESPAEELSVLEAPEDSTGVIPAADSVSVAADSSAVSFPPADAQDISEAAAPDSAAFADTVPALGNEPSPAPGSSLTGLADSSTADSLRTETPMADSPRTDSLTGADSLRTLLDVVSSDSNIVRQQVTTNAADDPAESDSSAASGVAASENESKNDSSSNGHSNADMQAPLDHTVHLYVEDLFDIVAQDFPRTPFAERAKTYLDIISELRNPPAAPAADSTGIRDDSLDVRGNLATDLPDSIKAGLSPVQLDSLKAVAGADRPDSTGISVPLVELEPSMLPDSTDTANNEPERQTDQARNAIPESDSLNVYDEFGNPIKRILEAPDQPPGARPGQQQNGEAEDVAVKRPDGTVSEFPVIEVLPESFDESEEYAESSTLKPIDSQGNPDLGVVGWTVILERGVDMARARFLASRYTGLAADSGLPVLILAETRIVSANHVVAWGLFATQREAQEAVESVEDGLPDRLYFLLLTPAGDR